jgi:hypothetical protein
LAGLVAHGRFAELDFHGVCDMLIQASMHIRERLTIWMTDDLDDFGFSSTSDLTPNSFTEIEPPSPEFPSPSLISNAVVPEILACEGGEWQLCVSNETSRGVGVEAKQEWDEQMMGVPERFERLLTDLVMGSRVHEKHAEKHHMSCHATSLRVVDLNCAYGSDLRSLNIEKAGIVSWVVSSLHCGLLDVMSADMDDRKEQQSVCNLPMEPLRLVQWQPPNLRSYPFENVPAHRKENCGAVDRQTQTSCSRQPDRERQSIKTSQSRVLFLFDPVRLLAPVN